MLSHVALMMNPNLDSKQLKDCLEESFESKHRQLDGIAEMNREIEAQNEEFMADDQKRLEEAKQWNKNHPEFWMPLPQIKSKAERDLDRLSLVWQMELLVLLY